MQHKSSVVLDLDELRELLLRLADVDVRIAVVVEDAKEAIDADVHARRLEQGVVIRIDLDPALFQQASDRAI